MVRGSASVAGSIGTLLVLGASGDLAGRLLLPAVGQLLSSSQAPAALTLVGAGAEVFDEATWRSRVAAAFATVHATGPRVNEMVAGATYLTVDVTRPEDLQRLLEACDGAPAIYFALPPAVTAKACAALGQVSLPVGTALVLEKPFGVDETSATDLNAIIGALVPEDQIHRVDHFLGKSTVLNLLGLRFTNRLFEPLWSADHIERVDIVFDEPLGLENRARYYDGAGALVDMIQSHLLQVLALIAMDPPASLHPGSTGSEGGGVAGVPGLGRGSGRGEPPGPVHRRDHRRPAVARVRGRTRGGPGPADGNSCGGGAGGGHLAVGRSAVPVAFREGPGPGSEGDRDHLQAGAPVAAGPDR
jgi:glucose-6-phosphate 1-dehydrogenase